ncbi:MAG: NADH-quinone oxidoreductase subunit NuoG [Gammaproteobacteria bacterium]
MTLEIEINGQKLQAEPGTMIIQAADDAGVYIPRFCYHKKLSIAANCRMCLVEVGGARKPMPACATPVAAGMKVFTQSPLAVDAQRAVMEFLLINHPLDCPICDQGGECELQDLSMGYGSDISRYNEGKRVVEDKNIGPLIKTDMTRCIQCTRCVRFGDEIAGMPELGAVGRGEHMEITTYLEHNMQSELSGNIIDLCPVGALTNKPYRYTARAWDLSQYASIAPHDCVGSHLFVHTVRGKVKRVVSKDCETINETWLSDRDRYSCFGLYHAERLAQPQVKIEGVWQTVDWDTALNMTSQRLRAVIEPQGPDQVAGLLSPNSTVEEAYLFQRLLRGIGSQNIDHRLRQQDFVDDACQPAYPGLTSGTIADFDKVSTALIVGSNLRKEQPILNLRLRKAALKGAKVYFINPLPISKNFPIAGERIDPNLVQELAAVAHAIADKKQLTLPANWSALFKDLEVKDTHREIASALIEQQNKAVLIIGTLALHHPQASQLRSLAVWIVQQTGAQGCGLTEGANSAGAWLAGAVPHRLVAAQNNAVPGLNANEMFQQPRAAYVLLNVEPEMDSVNSGLALAALQQAQCVIALSSFTNPHMLEYADVLLPIGAFTETAGTFVNIAGEWQTFKGAAEPFVDSRPAWKVLRVLGNLFGLSSFDYVSVADVLTEVKALCAQVNNENLADVTSLKLERKSASVQLMRIAETPIYSIDALTRRSQPLQQTPDADVQMIRIHPHLAAKFGVREGDELWAEQQNVRVRLPVRLDDQMPEHAVGLPNAIEATVGMGASFAPIELLKDNK